MAHSTMERTPPPIGIEADKINAILQWITPPVGNSVCPFTGLKHAKFYLEFVGNPAIRQVRTGTGKDRGKRLLWLPDIQSYLFSKAEGGLSND